MTRPKTGGRQKGTPNRVTAELRLIAAEHGPTAVKELVAIGLDPKTKSKSEATRIAAIKELLDRGFGRPSQSLEHSGSIGQTDFDQLTDDELRAYVESELRDAGFVRSTSKAK